MWPSKPKESTYLPVETSESGSEVEYGKELKTKRRHILSWTHLLMMCLFGALGLIVGFVLGELVQDKGFIARLRASSTQFSKCSSPTIRKEWRSLSAIEKEDYLTAVKCLTIKQSKLSKVKGDTLYNDFPYLHTTIGGYCEYRENYPKARRHFWPGTGCFFIIMNQN
jgi:hypothetical protein